MYYFLASCACGTYGGDATDIYAYGGKCYAMMDGIGMQSYSTAQTNCQNVGAANAGRLATFTDCAAYTAISNNFPDSNSYDMWIGIQSANSGPYWDDPSGLCSAQEILSADLETTCNGSTWNPDANGCIAIQSNWANFQGYSCGSTLNSSLCEFGKFRNTLYV